MAKAIIILGLIIAATSANAALYKCKSVTTGTLYFRDTPCLKGDIQLSVTGITTTTSTTVTDWGTTTAVAPTTAASIPVPSTTSTTTATTTVTTTTGTTTGTTAGTTPPVTSSVQPLVVTIQPENQTPLQPVKLTSEAIKSPRIRLYYYVK